MFQLKQEEYQSLRFQFGILEKGQHAKYLPYAFAEQGVEMLSSVLRSKRAVQVNIAIMRTFVRLREMLSTHKELARKVEKLEQHLEGNRKIKKSGKEVNFYFPGCPFMPLDLLAS